MLHVLGMPLAKFLGIRESSKLGALLEFDYSPNVVNHLNFFHASAIYSLAEISSGAFLLKNFSNYRNSTIPLVRKSVIKYSAIPANNTLYSTGVFVKRNVELIRAQLLKHGKASIEIQINIFDFTDALIFRGQFEWVVRTKEETLNVSKTVPSMDK